MVGLFMRKVAIAPLLLTAIAFLLASDAETVRAQLSRSPQTEAARTDLVRATAIMVALVIVALAGGASVAVLAKPAPGLAHALAYITYGSLGLLFAGWAWYQARSAAARWGTYREPAHRSRRARAYVLLAGLCLVIAVLGRLILMHG
jgi:hypothetical protein